MKTLLQTLNENIIITDNTADEVRKGMNYKKFTPDKNGRIAVIAATPYAKGKNSLGVQFWTESDIKKGSVINAGGTVSTYVEHY